MPFQTFSAPELLLNIRRFQHIPFSVPSYLLHLSSLPSSTLGTPLNFRLLPQCTYKPLLHCRTWPLMTCPWFVPPNSRLNSSARWVKPWLTIRTTHCPALVGLAPTLPPERSVPLTSASKRRMGLWDGLPLDTCITLTRSQVSRRLGPYSLTSICIPRYALHRRNLSVHESTSNPGDLHRKCQMCHCGK